MAVGEIGTMMTSAKNIRLDMLYELAADLEIFKLQVLFWFNRCCKCCFIRPDHYKRVDLTKKWSWWNRFKKELLEACAQEAVNDSLSDASEDEENRDNSSYILQDIKTTLQQINKPSMVAHPQKIGSQIAKTGMEPKSIRNKR